MDTTHPLLLGDLSDSACATILNTIALDGRSEEEREQLGGIGSDIAKKCRGLPQAAKTIARMLKRLNTVQEWEVVSDSPMWTYKNEMGDTYNALRLSYADLSPIHKRCFLSCALYPKGTKFNFAELIRIWMAQGYISKSATCEQAQEQGMGYFRVLFDRSFFQEVGREEIFSEITCKMHDVMHDLAVGLASSEYYFVEGNGTLLQSAGRIHCYCVPNLSEGEVCPPNFMSYLKCARVLCLRDCGLKELPEDVGVLIHLRYLDLSENPIEELPESLCNLYNLQTLDLRHSNVIKLPRAIGNLVKLKHLLIFGLRMFEYPCGFRKLKGLWTLEIFTATSDSIGYLENLNELSEFIQIVVRGENIKASEAEKANLKSKTQLKTLELLLFGVNMDVTDAMVPPPELTSLFLLGEGIRLPRWITTVTHLTNLKMLKIQWRDVTSYNLPPLDKLPMLEMLDLSYMAFKRIGLMEFLGSGDGFSKLKILKFGICRAWEEWEDLKDEEDGGVVRRLGMPHLEELELSVCYNLKALPHKLLSMASRLRKLTIRDCDLLKSRYHQKFGADRDKISHIQRIINIY